MKGRSVRSRSVNTDHGTRYARALEQAAGTLRAIDQEDPASVPFHRFERTLTPVQALRERFAMTQEEFSATFGIALGTLRNWEQGRREPEGAAQVLLRLIEAKPSLVQEVLCDARAQSAGDDDHVAGGLPSLGKSVKALSAKVASLLCRAALPMTVFGAAVKLTPEWFARADELDARPVRLVFLTTQGDVGARCALHGHYVWEGEAAEDLMDVALELDRPVSLAVEEPFSMFRDNALIGRGIVTRTTVSAPIADPRETSSFDHVGNLG